MPYILVCLVWSCRWSAETWTGSLFQTLAARCFGRRLCRPLGWVPALLQLLLDRLHPLCSKKQEVEKNECRTCKEQDGGCTLCSNDTPTLDLTTLPTLSFSVTSTAVSLAAIVLFRWPVTGSRLLEIAGEDKTISRNSSIIRRVALECWAGGQERRGRNTSLQALLSFSVSAQHTSVTSTIFNLTYDWMISSIK